MKISLAQTKPTTGDIAANIIDHKRFVELAASKKADMIVFPELSLTSYEPTLASALATRLDDQRLDELQHWSDDHNLIIGAGIPLVGKNKPTISMIIFQPRHERRVYSKKYLHPDEDEFFVSGENLPVFTVKDEVVALAICYEISIPEHLAAAMQHAPTIYVASVAKFDRGIEKAIHQLSDIANKDGLMTLMSNCVGPADGGVCAGKTSVWNSDKLLLGQLDDHRPGLLTVDTNAFVIDAVQW